MEDGILPIAPAVIKLLQGVVYNDDRTIWNCLIQYQNDIKQHFSGIGIDVIIRESDGFAFLKQKDDKPDQENPLPHLIERRQLSYPVTLLSVLLYEKIVEFESQSRDTTRLILDREEIKELMRIFLPEGSNEARLMNTIDNHINRLKDLGILRELSTNPNKFEVRKILKAKIPIESLQEIKTKLKEHAKLLS
jgi:hypothetical protein